MLSAIPLQLNGLVTPTPLKQFDPEAVTRLDQAFFGFRDAVGDLPQINLSTEQALDFTSATVKEVLAQEYPNSPVGSLATSMHELFDPLMKIVQHGDTKILETTLQISGGRVGKGEELFLSSSQIHSDFKVERYRQMLAKNCIMLRAMLSTKVSPRLYDISGADNPFRLIRNEDNLQHLERWSRYRKSSYRLLDGQLVLMDMLTPHKAYRPRKLTDRVLADAMIVVQLPEDWRKQVKARLDQPARLAA